MVRVLRLELGEQRLELHPAVSVVRGLDPHLRQRFVDALARLPRGEIDGEVRGIVEAHGVLLDLTDESLALLDIGGDLKPVVEVADLPASEADTAYAAALASLSAAELAAAGARSALERAELAAIAAAEASSGSEQGLARAAGELERLSKRRVAAEREADDLGTKLTGAQLAVTEAEATVAPLRRSREAAAQAVEEASTALREAEERLDPMAVAAAEAARRRLAAAQEAVRAGREEPATDLAAAIEATRARRVRIETELSAITTVDPFPVQLALEQLDMAPDERVPVPEADALAERWLTVERALAALAGAPGEDLTRRRIDAEARLEEARHALAEAESSVRSPALDPMAVAELEAAHSGVLSAREAVERPFGRARAEAKLAEAITAEQAVLDRLGFVTYAEYLMGVRADPDPGAPHRLAAARSELAAVEAELEELEAIAGAELDRAGLVVRQRALREEAGELLGADPGDDVVAALREHRVPASTTSFRTARLRAALDRGGVAFGDEVVPEPMLRRLATTWLAEVEGVAARKHELEREAADAEGELAELLRLEREASAGPGATAPALARLDEASRNLEVAEARAERHRVAERDAAAARHALLEATAREVEITRELVVAEEVAQRARAALTEASAAVHAAQDHLAECRASERGVAEELQRIAAELDAARAAGPEALAARARDTAARAESARRARTAADAELDHWRKEVEARRPAGNRAFRAPVDPEVEAENLEWYLLSRLAAQREVSYAGSVPIVLDDVLGGLEAPRLRRVLDKLERLAGAVQVVILSEDLAPADWARGLGPDRAAVVEPA